MFNIAAARAFANTQWLGGQAADDAFNYTRAAVLNLMRPGDNIVVPVREQPWAMFALLDVYEQLLERQRREDADPARHAVNARHAARERTYNAFLPARERLAYLVHVGAINHIIYAALELQPGDLDPLTIDPKFGKPALEDWEGRAPRVIHADEVWNGLSRAERALFIQRATAAHLANAVAQLQTAAKQHQETAA